MNSEPCDNVTLELPNPPSLLDLQSLFPGPAPLHIEIGPGKGAFLLQQARKHPELNFLAVEWASKSYRYCADRLRRWKITNARIVRTDARLLLDKYIPPDSIDAFHVYFPDPWPKTRHHKRRFYSPENLARLFRCLKPGGELRTATDHADYFEVIKFLLLGQGSDPCMPALTPDRLDLAAQIRQSITQIDFNPADAANPGEFVGSNFERKYRKQGRAFYTLAFRKNP